jgi:hypothetical protein
MSNKKYLARTKAMQIRMNISTLEDWARTNNRQPEHFEGGMTTPVGETTIDSARRHLAPVVQLLQWLQCFSSLGDDEEAMETTIQQLPTLSAMQLLHAVKFYRAEVGEKTLSKGAIKSVQEIKIRINTAPADPVSSDSQPPGTPQTPIKNNGGQRDDDDPPERNLLNPALLLPFHLPTSTDMLVSYGAGFGGMNKERERRYIPSVPPEFLTKLDPNGGQGTKDIYENARWSENDSS